MGVEPQPDPVIAVRERVLRAMPWHDEANPDYTELDAILREVMREDDPSVQHEGVYE